MQVTISNIEIRNVKNVGRVLMFKEICPCGSPKIAATVLPKEFQIEKLVDDIIALHTSKHLVDDFGEENVPPDISEFTAEMRAELTTFLEATIKE